MFITCRPYPNQFTLTYFVLTITQELGTIIILFYRLGNWGTKRITCLAIQGQDSSPVSQFPESIFLATTLPLPVSCPRSDSAVAVEARTWLRLHTRRWRVSLSWWRYHWDYARSLYIGTEFLLSHISTVSMTARRWQSGMRSSDPQ